MILMSALSVSAKIIIYIEMQKNVLKYNIIFNIFSRPLLKPLYLYFRAKLSAGPKVCANALINKKTLKSGYLSNVLFSSC